MARVTSAQEMQEAAESAVLDLQGTMNQLRTMQLSDECRSLGPRALLRQTSDEDGLVLELSQTQTRWFTQPIMISREGGLAATRIERPHEAGTRPRTGSMETVIQTSHDLSFTLKAEPTRGQSGSPPSPERYHFFYRPFDNTILFLNASMGRVHFKERGTFGNRPAKKCESWRSLHLACGTYFMFAESDNRYVLLRILEPMSATGYEIPGHDSTAVPLPMPYGPGNYCLNQLEKVVSNNWILEMDDGWAFSMPSTTDQDDEYMLIKQRHLGKYVKCQVTQVLYVPKERASRSCVLKQYYVRGSDMTGLNFLKNEISVLKSLRHPQIVRFVREEARLSGILTEYIKGPNLMANCFVDEDLRAEMPLDMVEWIAMTAAKGLKYLHVDKGLSHGDVRPRNFIFTPTAGATIIGLEYAQSLPFKREIQTSYAGYWCPEYVRGVEAVGLDRDIWAFGMSILWMLGIIALPDDNHRNGFSVEGILGRYHWDLTRFQQFHDDIGTIVKGLKSFPSPKESPALHKSWVKRQKHPELAKLARRAARMDGPDRGRLARLLNSVHMMLDEYQQDRISAASLEAMLWADCRGQADQPDTGADSKIERAPTSGQIDAWEKFIGEVDKDANRYDHPSWNDRGMD